jgi:hypothetical protein
MEMRGQLYATASLLQGKSPCYPLDRRVCGPQSRSGRSGEREIPSLHRKLNPKTLIFQPVAQRYTD